MQRERPPVVLTGDAPRRTAIVATLGPASDSRACLEGMVWAGMDAVRLSMSNGSREWHTAMAGLIREVAARVGRPVRLLADLQGRKNRLGALPGGRATWQAGEVVVLSAAPGQPASHRTWTTFPWRAAHVPPGATIAIDDGAITLAVTDVDDAEVRCVVTHGGTVTAGRGVTVPGATNVASGLTTRDADDLAFVRHLGVDLVAVSFACSAADYHDVRALAPDLPVIGKVEHAAAVAAVPELAAAFDGLMVARGDLGTEIPFQEVPVVQKRVLAHCRSRGKMSMVATQLVHSMRERVVPTRAEASDVVNAVIDGAGSLVLTGETGYGQHPVRVVEAVRTLIASAERYLDEMDRTSAEAAPWRYPDVKGAVDVR